MFFTLSTASHEADGLGMALMRILCCSVFVCLFALIGMMGTASGQEAKQTFVNPIYAGQDPYLMKGPDGAYYQASSINKDRGIAVYRSEGLTTRGVRRVVYRAPDEGPYRAEVWAPEIHYFDGKWWIYTCADDGNNANHRMIVLQAETDDPLGNYRLLGEIKTPGWAIDGTVSVFPDGKRYCIWSAWPEGVPADSTQHLFISEMESPTKLTGPIVDLSTKMYPWETAGRPSGLNEGAQVIHRNGKTMIIYAASGSWTPDYCFGLMTLEGKDVLNAASWVKQSEPWFSKANDVAGPGHGCLIASPDGKEDWLVFHSSIDPQGSWNRCVNLKQVHWDSKGMPVAGKPTKWSDAVEVPSGEPALRPGDAIQDGFDSADRWNLLNFFNGNTVRFENGELQIRGDADRRFGDKAMLRGVSYDDFEVKTALRIEAGEGTAGVVFRAQNVGIGRFNFSGYVAELTADGELVLSRCNGHKLDTLQKTSIKVETGKWYELTVTAQGDTITASLGGDAKVTAEDSRFQGGQVGVRTDGVKAGFKGFSVTP
jgi:GH43 family beta-xylosidase